MKTFLVIGLGRFGTAVATELCALGNEVLAVDTREDLVQDMAPRVTKALTLDARDMEVLRALSAQSFDCAIVAVGNDIGASALITLNLKELGVEKIVCKAHNQVHGRVLEKIGADKVVIPEHEMGTKLAHALSNASVLNFIELSDEASILEVPVPADWVGKSFRELDVRNVYKVDIIALRRSGGKEFVIAPGGDAVLKSDDIVVALGLDQNINRIQKL